MLIIRHGGVSRARPCGWSTSATAHRLACPLSCAHALDQRDLIFFRPHLATPGFLDDLPASRDVGRRVLPEQP